MYQTEKNNNNKNNIPFSFFSALPRRLVLQNLSSLSKIFFFNDVPTKTKRPIYTVRFLLTTVACNFCSARCSRHAKNRIRHLSFNINFIAARVPSLTVTLPYKTLGSIDHFTVVRLVPWPLSECEAGGDLVLIQNSVLFLWKLR